MPADTGGHLTCAYGAIIRGDTTQKKIALVFTADEFSGEANEIAATLRKENVRASFFLTGRFYSNPHFAAVINSLVNDRHYLGAHSNQHLLYCDWTKRDSLLITGQQLRDDLEKNYQYMKQFGIGKAAAHYFLPPYEWYNDSIAVWTGKMGLQLINQSPGTLSAADYTWPALGNYRSSEEIYQSITNYNAQNKTGLNGFILLLHLGTDPRRPDKFSLYLPQLLKWFKQQHYQLVRIDELLRKDNRHQ